MRPMWKFIFGIIAVFFAWYLFTQPVAAGHTVSHLLSMLQQAGNSIATFLSNI